MNVLVGYTGFVGSNIYAKGQFDYVFNSSNIQDSYGLNPDLLIYAGLRAEKYLANFLEEIPSLSHSVVFLYFFALIAEEGFLISSCYSLEL